jgi:peptide/nickel transport system permease protein
MTIDFATLMGGAVVTENVFGWKGMGAVLLSSLNNQDVNTISAWLVVTGVLVIGFNLIADILYGFLDPRVRYE